MPKSRKIAVNLAPGVQSELEKAVRTSLQNRRILTSRAIQNATNKFIEKAIRYSDPTTTPQPPSGTGATKRVMLHIPSKLTSILNSLFNDDKSIEKHISKSITDYVSHMTGAANDDARLRIETAESFGQRNHRELLSLNQDHFRFALSQLGASVIDSHRMYDDHHLLCFLLESLSPALQAIFESNLPGTIADRVLRTKETLGCESSNAALTWITLYHICVSASMPLFIGMQPKDRRSALATLRETKLAVVDRDNVYAAVSSLSYNGTQNGITEILFIDTRTSNNNGEPARYGSMLVSTPPNRRHADPVPSPPARSAINTHKHGYAFGVNYHTKKEWIRLIRVAARSYPKDCCVFVHGHNNSFDVAAMRCSQVFSDTNLENIPILALWDAKTSGLIPTKDYRQSSNESRVASARFSQVVKHYSSYNKLGGSVHIIAHSLGGALTTDVVFATSDYLRSKKRCFFGEVALVLPDIYSEEFAVKLKSIGDVSNRSTLYSSGNDLALIASSLLNSSPRSGMFADEAAPQVCPNVSTIDISNLARPGKNAHNPFNDPDFLLDLNATVKSVPEADRDALQKRVEGDSNWWVLLPDK